MRNGFLLLVVLLTACQADLPQPGSTMEQLVAQRGAPTGAYGLPDGRELEYASGPFGQTTWMARFGHDDRLISFEQVLDAAHFQQIAPGRSTEHDVLLIVGRPSERSEIALTNEHVWSYRYKEAGLWNSMMHVHFNEQGTVTRLLNAPDPLYDERRRH